VSAPNAVIVAELPTQIADGEATMPMVGLALTINETVCELEHPFELVPVTV
jgi:hypothetical protein